MSDTPLSNAVDRSGVPGAAGAAVSSVTFNVPETAETLPARSVWVAVMALLPSVSAMVGVIDQAPPAATVPVPIVVVPSNSVTVAPSSPVPLKVGRARLLICIRRVTPLSDAALDPGVLGAIET